MDAHNPHLSVHQNALFPRVQTTTTVTTTGDFPPVSTFTTLTPDQEPPEAAKDGDLAFDLMRQKLFIRSTGIWTAPIPERYRSTTEPIALPHNYTWTHGLEGQPDIIQVYVTPTINSHGYTAGERVYLATNSDGDGARNYSVSSTDTTITIQGDALAITSKSTPSSIAILSDANWRIGCTAMHFIG